MNQPLMKDNQNNELTLLPNEDAQQAVMNMAMANLWQEPLSYLAPYAQICDSVLGGWFLSWFFSICPPYEEKALSNEDICSELGLTPTQWGKVRALLVKQELLIYRTEKKQAIYSRNVDKVEWLLREILSNPLAAPILCVNRLHLATLTDLGVSINAVLLLSWLIDELPAKPIEEREEISEPILINHQNITIDTFLNDKQISNALKELDNIGVTQTKKNPQDKNKYSVINSKVLGDMTLAFTQKQYNALTGGNDDENAAT